MMIFPACIFRTTAEARPRSRPARVLSAFCVLCGVIASAAQAEAQTDEGTPWSLSRLIQHALKNNQGLAASRLATGVSQEDVKIAKGQRWPRVDGIGKVLYFPIHRRLLIERHGRRPSNPFQNLILNYGLQVTMPLYTGGRIPSEISLAEASVAASQSRAELTRQELIFNITSSYYTYLRVREVIAANEALVRSVGESRRIILELIEVGRAAQLDLFRLDTRLSEAETQLAVAQNSLDSVAATLKALLALPPEEPFQVDGALSAAQESVDPETARANALSLRPDLIALKHEIEAQKARVGIARAFRRPKVDASVQYGGATGVDETLDDAKFLIALRVPLFAGGILGARKRKALARLRELQAKLAAAERLALLEVERALIGLSSAKARLESGSRAVAQGGEALRVERVTFREGRGTGNDLLLAEQAVLRAKTEFAAAMADSQIATVALQLAMGQLDAPSHNPSSNELLPGLGGGLWPEGTGSSAVLPVSAPPLVPRWAG